MLVQYPFGHADEAVEQAADGGVDDGGADDALFFGGGDEFGVDEVARGVVGDGVEEQERRDEGEHVGGGRGDAAGADGDVDDAVSGKVGQVVFQHFAEEVEQARREGEAFLSGVAADGAVREVDDGDGGGDEADGGAGDGEPFKGGQGAQAVVEGFDGDDVLADEGTRAFEEGGTVLCQGGGVATEAVLLGELGFGELAVLAVGDVAAGFEAEGVVGDEGFELLVLFVNGLLARFVGIQRGAALAGVEFVLLADEVLVVVDLRGEGVKAGLCGGEFGADTVDAFEREAGEVRILDFLQAGFLGKQFVFDLGVVDLGVDEGEFVVVVKAGIAVGFVVIETVVEFLAAGLQLVEAVAVSLVGSGLAGFEVAFVVALVAGFEQGFLAVADSFGLGEDVFLSL